MGDLNSSTTRETPTLMTRDIVYNRLPADTIRLLSLDAGARDDPLTSRLLIYRLHESPQYEALSYCWGKAKAVRLMTIIYTEQGVVAERSYQEEITQNLYEALCHLRLQDRPRILWIDAICINQEDFRERSQQVSLMKQIYRGAARVIAWLGVDCVKDGAALRFTEHINETPATQGDATKFKDVTVGPGFLAKYLGMNALPDVRKADLDAFLELLQRPYWTRVWIIQELSLARSAFVAFDHVEIEWHKFGLAAFWAVNQVESRYHTAFHLLGATHIWQQRFFDDRAICILFATRSWHATDSRDKIYSLLGFDPVANAIGVQPDYAITVEDLFSRVTRNHISHSRTLHVLSLVQHPVRADDKREQSGILKLHRSMPSWVPAFDVPYSANMAQEEVKATPAIDLRSLDTSQEPGVLRLEGVLACKVADIDGQLRTGSLDPNLTPYEVTRLQSFYEKYVKRLKSAGRSEEARKAFAIALTHGWDRIGKHYKLPITAAQEVEVSMRHTILQRWSVLPTDASSPATVPVTVEEERAFLLGILFACRGRRLFITDDGHIGIALSQVLPGDVVTVLFGGHNPFILRPVGDRWQLVGIAYAYGLVEGVAEDMNAGTVQPTVFDIV